MRRLVLIAPVVVLLAFACGKLATKRNDGDKSSAEKTETTTDTSTDTATDVPHEVVKEGDVCLTITTIADEATMTQVQDAQCEAKAQFCETDDQCAMGHPSACGSEVPVNKLLKDLVDAVGGYRGRAADCAYTPQIKETNFQFFCDNGYCAAKASVASKDGTKTDCTISRNPPPDSTTDHAVVNCQNYLCESVYFGKLVDMRTYAETGNSCKDARPAGDVQCYQVVSSGTQTVLKTFRWMTAAQACQMFDSAAAE